MKKTAPLFYDTLPEQQVMPLLRDNILFLFINPTEYHGPHLPLANDYLISRGIADRLVRRLIDEGLTERYVIAPFINLGLDPTPGAGTINTSPAQFAALLSTWADKLPLVGAKRVLVMTFHGAPRHNHAIQRFIDKLLARGVQALNPLNLLLAHMMRYQPGDFTEALEPVKDAALKGELDRTLGRDYHAGFFETSLTLALAPDSVDPDYRNLPACPALTIPAWQKAALHGMRSLGQHDAARELLFAAEALAWLNLKPFPGYTGMPRLANRESGEIFVARILEEYLTAVRAVFVNGEAPPAPVLGVTDLISGLAGI